MKTFTPLLVVFVAAFILVTCDESTDLKALTQKIVEEYQKLNVNETKARVSENLKRMNSHLSEAADKYEKENLVVAAKWYKSIVAWSNEQMPKAAARMDKMEVKEKTGNWMEMGIAMQLIVDLGGMNVTSSVTPVTEGFSKKVYEEKKTKVMRIVKAVADGLKKKADKQFWADVHQKVYEFLEKLFKEIETEMKSVKTSELRVQNYRKITNYLEGLLKATEFRANPHTFFAKIQQKLKYLVDKIKSIF